MRHEHHDILPPLEIPLSAIPPEKGQWHEISCEDVAVTDAALDAMKQAARRLLPQYVPQSAMSRITVGDGLALLAQDIYWDQETGRLCLCAEICQRRYCLHIPPEHWEFRISGTLH